MRTSGISLTRISRKCLDIQPALSHVYVSGHNLVLILQARAVLRLRNVYFGCYMLPPLFFLLQVSINILNTVVHFNSSALVLTGYFRYTTAQIRGTNKEQGNNKLLDCYLSIFAFPLVCLVNFRSDVHRYSFILNRFIDRRFFWRNCTYTFRCYNGARRTTILPAWRRLLTHLNFQGVGNFGGSTSRIHR